MADGRCERLGSSLGSRGLEREWFLGDFRSQRPLGAPLQAFAVFRALCSPNLGELASCFAAGGAEAWRRKEN